jgi:hypothetical protein
LAHLLEVGTLARGGAHLCEVRTKLWRVSALVKRANIQGKRQGKGIAKRGGRRCSKASKHKF